MRGWKTGFFLAVWMLDYPKRGNVRSTLEEDDS